jgi:hypothetical protein
MMTVSARADGRRTKAPMDEIALCRARHSAIYAEGQTMPHRNVFTEIHRPDV